MSPESIPYRIRRSDRARRVRGRRLRAAEHPRPAHPLGKLLVDGNAELQLAAAPRPRGRARLRRLARGLPPEGPRPLAALLAHGRPSLRGLARARALAAEV